MRLKFRAYSAGQFQSHRQSKDQQMRYDLIVIGSGPAGQKAAIAAAKQNWSVAVVERKQELLGGVSLHTGTIPSKTIREAILHLTGYRHRDVYEPLDQQCRKRLHAGSIGDGSYGNCDQRIQHRAGRRGHEARVHHAAR